MQSFLAFCFIDQSAYEEAKESLLVAQELNNVLLAHKVHELSISRRQSSVKMPQGFLERFGIGVGTTRSSYAENLDVLTHLSERKLILEGTVDAGEEEEDEDLNEVNMKATYDEYIKKRKPPPPPAEAELLYLRRVDFIILYHICVTVYMQRHFDEAFQVSGSQTPLPFPLQHNFLVFYSDLLRVPLRRYEEVYP